jgi:hypothetical protein
MPDTLGIAPAGDSCLIARVTDDGARRIVTSLDISPAPPLPAPDNDEQVACLIPDRMAQVRDLRLAPGPSRDGNRYARFEAAQSLLGRAEDYYFDIVEKDCDAEGLRFLVIASHRPAVDTVIASYRKESQRPIRFKTSAKALADGYLAFCRAESGELQVLANFDCDAVSLAFIHKGKLYSLARLDSPPGSELSPEAARRLAMEFKMLLSFQQAGLFRDGITVPPSHLIMAGTLAADPRLRESLTALVHAPIILPPYNRACFRLADHPDNPPALEKFLVPLGLTVP